MMGDIWLVSCSNSALPNVRDEIFARDAHARLLRCSEMDMLAALAEALSEESMAEASISVALCLPGADEGAVEMCEAALQVLSRGGSVREIMVFVERADPGLIARCFFAGATEVITAGDAELIQDSVRATEPCMGREASGVREAGSPADDDMGVSSMGASIARELGGCGRQDVLRNAFEGSRRQEVAPTSPVAEGVEARLAEESSAGAGAHVESRVAENSSVEGCVARRGPSVDMTEAAAAATGGQVDAADEAGGRMDAADEVGGQADAAGETAGHAGLAGKSAGLAATGKGSEQAACPDAGRTGSLAGADGDMRPVSPDARGAVRCAASVEVPRAPMVTVISGRGGCGKTTLVASMAACAARAGLRAAVLDFDLMFGNLHALLGVSPFKGLEGVSAHAEDGLITESDIEGAAMRVGPGLTLWGSCGEAERAELMGTSAEQLVEVLRGAADVIFVDTSVTWGDTVAMAVEECDRCIVVGTAGASTVVSTRRVIELAQRLGVPTTRMTSVFNRVGARGCSEDQALQFEMGVSLRSRARIPDGGEEVAGMLSFGHVDSLVAGSSPFARSIRTFTSEMLRELGCPVNAWLLEAGQAGSDEGRRSKLRVPWRQGAGGAR